MIKRKTKKMAFSISLISVLLTAGCLQTPDIEYVTNKEGQNTLISDNAIGDNGIPIAQQVQAPARATGSCEKVNEYTSIEVDADVIVPSGTTVPVYTVAPIRMDAQEIEACTSTLFETGEFYNREYDLHVRSVEELYEEIEYYTRILNTAAITNVSQPVFDENRDIIEMNAEYKEQCEETLNFFQQELAVAEELPTYGSPISYDFVTQTSKIAVPVRQNNMTVWDMEGETYDYEFESATFTGRNNGIEYDLSIYQDELNTELRFALPWSSRLSNGYSVNEVSRLTEHKGSYMLESNTCNYSQEEAVALCKDFLTKLGIDNMEAQYVTDIYLICGHGQYEEEFLGKKGWRVYLYWGIEDMGECFSPADKVIFDFLQYSTGESALRYEMEDVIANDYSEDETIQSKTWRGMAVFEVLDEGIINAWIQNPVENKEILAENVKLLDFDQVLDQGIAHMESLYGDSGTRGSYGRKDIRISVIELNYARMQAPDTEGEFAMIPVWDFKTGPNGECMVSINAIDGSVFDREQGY